MIKQNGISLSSSTAIFLVFGLSLSYSVIYQNGGVAATAGNTNQQGQSASANQLPLWASNASAFSVSRATTLNGVPVPSLTATQSIGSQGPPLLQDYILIDKLASFVRERIPERVVHAKGAGAHGFFEVTHDISRFTKAKFLNGIGKRTPVFVRFSTTNGELGSADTGTDTHGFAIKFYTEDGIHDIAGNDIEAFFIRDPMMFSDFSRSRKRNPQTNLREPNSWWDIVSLRTEATLNVLQIFSDRGRPNSYSSMDGFSIHAFKLVNQTGGIIFGKFIFKTSQPAPAFTHEQASSLAGSNPDYYTQDLFDTIARGETPSWYVFLQMMTVDQINNYRRDPFDITAPWRPEEVPYMPIGKLTLNRNPLNFFAEVEQSLFQPSNLVPGIEPSPDRILAARMFAYQDSQRYRLTVNGPQLPINRPLTPIISYDRDGQGCSGLNGGNSPNYFPNSFGGYNVDPEAKQQKFFVEGLVDRFEIPTSENDYHEARLFLERDVGLPERKRMVSAIADRLKLTSSTIWERVLKNNFYPVDKKLGDEVRSAVYNECFGFVSLNFKNSFIL